MGRIKGKALSYEAILLTSLKQNDIFYTDKTDRNMTGIATFYKISIKTQRCFIVNPDTLETKQITRVTIAQSNSTSNYK